MSALLCPFLAVALFICMWASVSSSVAEDLIRRIPKIELHAHLHGSIRLSTLQSLSEEQGHGLITVTVSDEHNGQVEKPFELFPLIHRSVITKDIVLRILHEMIEDYEAENVLYLEIRTTPRSLPDGTTTSSYVQMLVDAISAHNQKSNCKMLVKLILSVDRGKSFGDGSEVMNLLKEYANVPLKSGLQEKVIVGVDFSGNPLGGEFSEFRPIFEEVRRMGFKVTVHAAEAEDLLNHDDHDELDDILDFAPDRLGHMLYLHDRHLKKLFQFSADGTPILVEICPSTSYFVLNLKSFSDHPYIRKFYSVRQPISLNTDDSAIFNTTITKEVLHMMYALDWNPSDILRIQANSLSYLFAIDTERALLRDKFWSIVRELQEEIAQLHSASTRRLTDEHKMIHSFLSITPDNVDQPEVNSDLEDNVIRSALEAF